MATFKVTGVPDFTQLKSEINKLQGKPIKIRVETQSAKSDVSNVQREINQLGTSAEKTGISVSNMFTKLAAVSPVYAAAKAFREALDTMKAVDTELVSIQKVTGYTAQQMDKLSESAYNLASQYGRTADEVLAAATTFARAGYEDQIETLAELSLLTQNVGDVSADTASKFIIAADAAWKLGGNETKLREILDGLNEITNRSAVDMGALTEAITVGGSVFAEAGESAQTFAALVGAGVASTQRSGSEIARALRTILMNIRQIRGETEDGELIDGESIANASKALKEYAGISTMANGQLRLASDVLDELAEKWKKLDAVAQSAISEALAGKRQSNVLMALMGNWETVEQAIVDYANGAGSALEENEYYLNSWEAKSKQLSAAWTEFVSHLIEPDAIKGALDGVIGLVELLDTDVGQFVVTAAAATAGFAVLVETVKSLKGLELVKDVKAFGGVLIDAAKGSGTLSDALGLLNLKSLAVVGGIAALVALIMGLKQMYEATFPTAESFTASINEANEKIKTNKERLDEINNIPWNERTEAILSEKKALEEENEELEKNIELTEQRSVSAAKTALFGSEGSAAYVAGGTALGGFRPGGDADSTATTEANIKAAQEYIAVLREEGQLTDEQNIKVQDLLETMQERAAYYEILKNHSSELNESELEKLDLLAQEAQSYEDLVSAYDQAVYGAEALINAYVELNNNTYITEETYQRLIGIYPQLADAATQTADGYVIQKEALENLMSAEQRQQAEAQATVQAMLAEAEQAGYTGQALYDYAASLVAASNTALHVDQQMSALQALAVQAGYTAQAIAQVMGLSNVSYMDTAATNQIRAAAKGLMQSGQAKTSQEAMEMARANYIKGLWGSLTTNYTPSTPSVSYPSSGGGYSGSGGSGSSGSSGNRGYSSGSSGSSSSSSTARKEAQAEIKRLQKERDAELDVIQKQIDALQEQADIEDRQAKIEEYKLEILKKQDAVMNARNERTVRQYNASTGQWEWVADATKVKKAEEELENAKKQLREYERKVELDLAVEELKNRQEAIKAAYQIKIDAWQDYLDGLSNAVFSESQYLNQSVANNKAAVDQILAERSRLNENTDNNTDDNTSGGIGGSAGSAGGSSSRDNEAAGNQDATRTPADLLAIGAARGGTRPATGTYNNMGIGTGTIMYMQQWYGATADGKWGGASYDAANNRTAESAYNLWKAYAEQYSSFAKFKSETKYYDAGGILKGMGGIKATPQDEIVLPPKLAAKMLTPLASQTFRARISELGYMYGSEATLPKSLAGNCTTDSHNVTTQYIVNGVQIGAYEAEHMSMADVVRGLAGTSHHLQTFGNET